jgi:hypothetical protein
MKLTDSGSGNYEQPPTGTHVARCVRMIDLGTQKGEYQGRATSKRQIILAWELPLELMSEGDAAGKPFLVSKFYTASLNEKATLRHDLANWRGRDFTPEELSGFDSKNLIGKTCMLSITLNDKGKAKVTGVMALPKGTEVPAQCNKSLYFSMEPGEYSAEIYEGLSEGIKKMIYLSPEFTAAQKRPGIADMPSDNIDDDIPF